MSASLLWKDLSAANLASLGEARDAVEARRMLIDILGFETIPSPKALVLLEFYVNNLRFAAESRFTTEKTSAFFSIMRANHEETVHGLLSLDQSLLYFKELLLLHSVQRPPYSVGIFSFKDVTHISDYANSTYFKHFKLFQYCFTQSHELVLTSRSNLAETAPNGFPPLWESIQRAAPEPVPETAPATEAESAPAAAADEAADLDADLSPEMRNVINNKIQVEVRKMQAAMEKQFQEREARLVAVAAAVATATPPAAKK